MSPRRACLFAVVPALALAACGGGGSSTSTPTAPANPNLTVIAEEIHFDQKQYSVADGEVRVAYPNQGTQTHTLIVQDPKGDDIAPKLRVGPGQGDGRRLPAGAGHVHAVLRHHRATGPPAWWPR